MTEYTFTLPNPPSTLWCAVCAQETPRRSPSQKYCPACSSDRNAERQRRWDRKHYPRRQEKVSATMARGREISAAHTNHIFDTMNPIELAWLARVAIPFDSAASKNFIYGFRQGGHVRLREQAKAYRDLIGYRIKGALINQPIVHNKVWLDIYIQKPSHNADAVNFVDTICDAVKRVISVDDRWFSIRRLDWQVVKTEPKIFIGIGQEVGAEDVQICSSCGRALAFAAFNKKRANKNGLSRNCRECLTKLPEPSKTCVVTVRAIGREAA